MKGRHGGRRVGAGRQPALLFIQRMRIGAKYQELWDGYREPRKAGKKKSEPERQIKKIQQEIKNPPANLKFHKDYRAVRSYKLDTIGRVRSAPTLKRPYGMSKIVTARVIDWYRQQCGVVVTPRRIAACLREFRKFEAKNKYRQT
jgi:hypothetical protein